MKRMILLSAMMLVLIPGAFAQDPLKVAPDAYKLDFENEWVKVTRVHYAPQAKIPAHDHTETGAAYIYLNDAGKVIFKHIGLSYGAITRPETKAGSVRLYKAVKEVHEVENPNDTPSDFLRVEFKTAVDAKKALLGKYFREAYSAGQDVRKVHFENEQIRVTRLACAATCEIAMAPGEPTLIVALTKLKWGKQAEAGKTKWIAVGGKANIQSVGAGHAEVLQFDFKSKPVKADGKNPSHEHAHQ